MSNFNVAVNSQDILAAGPGDWIEQSSAINGGNPTDIFTFTLTQNTGVFIDIDARDIGLSLLDSDVTIFDSGNNEVADNDDGYDFEGINPADGDSRDSSLYADLGPGTYEVHVEAFNGGSTGAYLMRMLFDTTYAAAVPVRNSLLGAAASVFLDFDGHADTDSWGTYSAAPFNFGGGPSGTFSPGERLAIHNVWSVVAEDYSPFNINVTTVEPGAFADRVAHRMAITESSGSIIGFGGSLGVAFVNSFNSGGPNNQVSWTFASAFSIFGAGSTEGFSGRIMASAIEQGNTTAHEFGHALGLRHWGTQPGNANGANVFPDGIMSTPDRGLNREIWQNGNRNSIGVPQDDVAVIANGTNGFGFRTDDHGDTLGTATALSPSGQTYSAEGIVSQLTDLDLFQFQASAATTITVDVDEYVNDLDVQIRLLDSAGVEVETSDPSDSFDGEITRTLADGTYYLEVTTDGEDGELGQYDVHITTTVGGGGSNTPPDAVNDDLTTTEDATQAGHLLANNGHGADSDAESPNSALSVTHINGSAVSNGQVVTLGSGALLTVNSNGDIVYNPNGQFESLAAAVSTTDSFTYTLTDPQGAIDVATVTVTINGVNDAPVATANVNSTDEDNSVDGNVLADGTPDSDVDNPSGTLTVSEVNGQSASVGSQITLASGALLTVNANGTYTYDPNEQFEDLSTSESDTDNFQYTVRDPGGLESSTTVAITVNGVNDAPTATANANSTSEDNSVGGNVLTDGTPDSDVDSAANTLVVSEVNGQSAGVGNQITLASGALLTVNANGTYAYDPNGQFESLNTLGTDNDSFQYTVRDPGGLESSAVVTITVNGVNDAPTATPDSNSTDEASTVNGNILDDGTPDSDVDDGDNALDVVQVNGQSADVGNWIDLPSGARLRLRANGSYSYDPNGSFEHLTDSQSTDDTFDYTIRDPGGLESTATVTITVNGVNDDPLATDNLAMTVKNSTVAGNLLTDDDGSGVDTDVDHTALAVSEINGQAVADGETVQLVSGALLTTFADGRYIYDPNGAFDNLIQDDSEVDSFTYTVADPLGSEDTARVDVTVFGSLLTVTGDTARLIGTPGDDVLIYRVVNRIARVNGIAFVVPAQVAFIEIDGLGGNDLLNLIATPGDDTAETRPGEVLLDFDGNHSGFDVSGVDLEIVILDGQGGIDAVTMHDSTLDDKFFVRPASGVLFAADISYQSNAFGFQITAIASTGSDLARFFDSTGDDTVTARPGDASLAGVGFLHRAQNFDILLARSLSGTDVADVFGSNDDDFFTGRNGFSVLTTNDVNYQFDSFETVNVDGQGGNDLARLLGGPGNDILTADPGSIQFLTGSSEINATSFERLVAIAGSGENDSATLADSAGDDLFAGSPNFGELSGAGYFLRTFNFDEIRIRGINGGVNTRLLNDVNYLLTQEGNWV